MRIRRRMLLLPVIWVLFGGVMLVAGEPESPTLRIHHVRSLDFKQCLRVLEGIVPEVRMLEMPESRAIAVYARASLQRSVAKAIADHERNAILFDRLDPRNADPQAVTQVVISGIKAAKSENADSDGDAFHIQFDPLSRQFLVRGRALEIDFVKQTIDAVSQHPDPPGTPSNDQRAKIATIDSMNEPPTAERHSLRVPSGPLRIVPVKGLDLLLIRGRPSDVEAISGE